MSIGRALFGQASVQDIGMCAVKSMVQISLLSVALLTQGCSSSNDITENERALLFTVADFSPYLTGSHDQARGLFSKETGLLAHSKQLSYEFTFEKSANETAFYINCIINLEPNGNQPVSRAAREIGTEIGMASGNLKQVPQEGFPKYGERSSVSLLTLEGRPVGNLFTAEYGSKSVMLVFSGIYVIDPEVWKKMFDKKLRLIESCDVSAAQN
jgi:hypothetical protein